MRVLRQHAFGGPEVLALEQAPEPVCPPDGYLVETRAVGVNFADIVERRGQYRRDPVLPLVLGKEAAGVVLARGAEATRFAVGDAVIVIRFENGCYAERLAASEDELLPAPPGFGFVELAAFAGSFLTAWYALREVARVRAGDALLVQAAAGALGSAAILLARAMGCDPILGVVGSPAKCAHVTRLGADACIDANREDFREVARSWTEGRGVDVCLESVGGEVYERSLEALAPLGRLVVLGFSSIASDHGSRIPKLHPLSLLHRSIVVGGLDVDALGVHRRRREWYELTRFCGEHGIRPVVGEVFPFERAAEAHALIESRRSMGKVVLTLEAPAPEPPQNWK